MSEKLNILRHIREKDEKRNVLSYEAIYIAVQKYPCKNYLYARNNVGK